MTPIRRGPKPPPQVPDDRLDVLAAALIERAPQRPHFRAFVISAGGALEVWPRPTTTGAAP